MLVIVQRAVALGILLGFAVFSPPTYTLLGYLYLLHISHIAPCVTSGRVTLEHIWEFGPFRSP